MSKSFCESCVKSNVYVYLLALGLEVTGVRNVRIGYGGEMFWSAHVLSTRHGTVIGGGG